MNDIIKSLVYKAKNNKILYLTFVIFLLFMFVTVTSLDDEVATGSMFFYYIKKNGFFLLLQSMIFCAMIAGSDFIDKTLNYEIMSGHTKKEIYYSRFVVSIVACVVTTLLTIAIPVITFSIINGWGDTIEIKDFIIRLFLSLLPVIRFAAFIQCISFIFKNHYAVLGLSFVILFSEFVVFSNLTNEPSTLVESIFLTSTFENILTVENKITEMNTVEYVSSLKNNIIVDSLIINLSETFAFVLLGHIYCKKTDLDT